LFQEVVTHHVLPLNMIYL